MRLFGPSMGELAKERETEEAVTCSTLYSSTNFLLRFFSLYIHLSGFWRIHFQSEWKTGRGGGRFDAGINGLSDTLQSKCLRWV